MSNHEQSGAIRSNQEQSGAIRSNQTHLHEGERIALRADEPEPRLIGGGARGGRRDERGALGGEHGDEREHRGQAAVGALAAAAHEQRLGVRGLERQLGHQPALGGECAGLVEAAEREELLERRGDGVDGRRRHVVEAEDVLDAERLARCGEIDVGDAARCGGM